MRRSLPTSFLLSFVVAFAGIACSSSSPAPQEGTGGQGSGGAVSSGGATGSGGANSGGTTGTAQTGEGGSTTTGGRSGTGGATATGGSTGTGGRTASGGVTGSGGATGTGGATSTAGGAGGAATGGAGSTGTGGTGPASGGRSGTDGGAGRDGSATGTGGTSSGGSGGQVGGTGGQSTSTGGSGGSTAYAPCKASPCIILPLGDSITHGFGSSDDAGYRSQLFKLAVAANQNITFTGTLSNGPSQVSGKTFPKNHDGHDGWTVDPGYSQYDTSKNQGVSLLVTTDKAFKTMPDIVLLHIGTNDLTSSSAKSTTSDRLDSLLTKIAGIAPNALVVVAKVIPLGYTSSDWDNYNAKIPGIVQAHAAKGEHMVMVDMSKLPSSQLNGVHPTDQGYATMAGYWYEAIKGFLP